MCYDYVGSKECAFCFSSFFFFSRVFWISWDGILWFCRIVSVIAWMDLDGERNVLPIRIGNVASVGQIELRLVVEEGVILCVNCGTGKARSSYEI